MARVKITLDDLALQLVQLDAADRAGVKRLRDRVRRLARETRVESVRVELAAAADALSLAHGAAGAAQPALEEAGRRVEAAMAYSEDAAGGGGGARRSADGTAVADGAPAMDPLMLEALAMLEAEEAAGERSCAAASASALGAMAAPPGRDPLEVTWSADADPELLEGFVAESTEYLQNAESALLELEANPSSDEAVNTVFRCFHTIKGTATFLGLDRVSHLAHLAESLMSRVRDREIRLVGGYAELALRSVDMLTGLVRAVATGLSGRPAMEPAGYTALYEALGDPEAALARMALQPAAGGDGGAADAPGAAAATTPATDVLEAWMRVRTDRLDRLVDTIGELVIAHSMIAQDGTVAATANQELSRKVAHATKIVRELQDLSISMRMVPLRGVIQKLARVVRDAAAKSGKQVELTTEGEDTEIDRSMVDVIGDPLVHMVRNAVDHGIESPDDREKAGKARRGTIHISARHAGGSVVITLTDDGRGLDRGRIIEKAVARGLVESDRGLSDRDVFELIFAPGFSTAEKVTDLSGRGVGMDVVRRSVEALRGRIDIESEPGSGSSFAIRLPLTLAITDGMLVRIGAERYILPTLHIQLSLRPDREMLSTIAGRGEMVLLRGEVLPIVRLHRMLNVPGAQQDPTRGLLVVAGSGERRCALLVDELLGQQQLVAKSLGDGIRRVPGISGGAILGDGRVGLILDIAEIVSISRSGATESRAA